MNLLDRLVLAWNLSKKFDMLGDLFTKIEALSGILERLTTIETRLSANNTLFSLASRLDELDSAVRAIETKKPESPKAITPAPPIREELQQWERLKLLSQFVQLHGKAAEIEKEWQRIQQDEHDYQFAFQSSPNEETQSKYLYRKGIADGIKWCVNQFS